MIRKKFIKNLGIAYALCGIASLFIGFVFDDIPYRFGIVQNQPLSPAAVTADFGHTVMAETETQTEMESETITETKNDTMGETKTETENGSGTESKTGIEHAAAGTETSSGSPEQNDAGSGSDTESSSISETAELKEQPPEYTFTVKQIKGKLYIRSGPASNTRAIGYMTSGATGEILNSSKATDKWLYISYNGLEGYVFKSYLEISEASPQ